MKKKATKNQSPARSAAKSKSGKQPLGRRSVDDLVPSAVIPGEILLGQGDVVAFEGRETRELLVANTGDRPIQVGSHCHFFEANRALRFDREKAFGFRLQVPAGTAVRFEPGEEKRVTLVSIAGNRVAYGLNGLTNGRLDDPTIKAAALARAGEQGFGADR
ncbi:urease subunit beta [Candidatus Nitrospira bockiana]